MDAREALQFRASARIGTWPLEVIAFEGKETLSEPFHFTFDAAVAYGTDIDAYLGKPTTLRWRDSDSLQTGERSGILVGFETIQSDLLGAWRVRFILQPRFATAVNDHIRIFRNKSIPELVRTVLEPYGYDKAHLEFRLERDLPARPYTLQAYESDFGFVQRLLARAGLLYWFESVNGREVMCVSDTNFQGEFLGPVTFHEPDGQSNRKGVVDDLRIRATMHTTSYRDHGPRPWTELAEETMAAKRLEGERIACERWRLHGGGDHAGLRAGCAIDLDGRRPGLSDVSGIYLIVVAHHRMEEATKEQPARYRCNFELIYRKTPFRPPVPMKPELPELFSARVESDGKLPCLDGEGRYRVALHADENRHPVAEGSPLLRKVEPYGGPRPRSGAAPGWRFALQPGDEVLLTCLASDPDQPYLIGYAPSATQLGPVTGANTTENMLRTPMGNLILFDDRKAKERIVINALDGRMAMTFSAQAEASFIQVAAQVGRTALYARKNLRLQSVGNLTERVGGERTQVVAQNSRTVTEAGDIHHQAAINAAISAGRYALLHANGKLQTVAAKRLRLHTRKGAHFTLFGPKGLVAKFHNGKVAVQSGGAIRIKGRGNAPITFAQNGGGFTIGPKGDIKLFGKRVTLKSKGQVKFNGPVDYKVPGGNEPESPAVGEAVEAEAVPRLLAENDPGIVGLTWQSQRLPVGEAAKLSFTLRQIPEGQEEALVTIYQADGERVGDELDSITVPLSRTSGVIEATWQSPANPDVSALTGPLAYRFDVAVGSIKSQEHSPPLYPTRTLDTAVTHNGEPVKEETLVALTTPDGQVRQAQVEDGRVCFEDVVLGPAKVRLLQKKHEVMDNG